MVDQVYFFPKPEISRFGATIRASEIYPNYFSLFGLLGNGHLPNLPLLFEFGLPLPLLHLFLLFDEFDTFLAP